MFIGNLNKEQQSYFLTIAGKLIASDGHIDDRETRVIETLRALCDPDASPMSDDQGVVLEDLFDDRPSKVSFLLELLGVAYADEHYDEIQKSMVENIASDLGISGVLMEDIENWVSRQMSMSREAAALMGVR